jgi:hypothetical protein
MCEDVKYGRNVVCCKDRHDNRDRSENMRSIICDTYEREYNHQEPDCGFLQQREHSRKVPMTRGKPFKRANGRWRDCNEDLWGTKKESKSCESWDDVGLDPGHRCRRGG